jgi:glycerophosphoryl diester phosphodiesterase
VHAFFEADRPMVFAHRGGGALAPENTLAAFDQAAALGVDGLELDVHLSADGRLVVCHDPTVDRTTNGSGRIRDVAVAELREFDAGYAFTPDSGRTFPWRGRGVCIPTLEEVLVRYDGMRFGVELKAGSVESARTALAVAESAGVQDRLCLGAFNQRPVTWLRTRAAGLATYATRPEVVRYLVWRGLGLARFAAPRADCFCVPEHAGRHRVVTPGLIEALARHGTPVHVWTVDEEDDMRRLLAWGVGGLVTDRPDLALRLLDRTPGPTVRQTSG